MNELKMGYFGGFGGVLGIEEQVVPVKKVNVRKLRRVELGDRDLRIIEFILDMKFARSADIFQKFFRKTLSAEDAKSQAWAKKRLFQLEQARYLTSTYSPLRSDRYFTATLKGYNALANVYPERGFTKPVRGIDIRTLAHDCIVLESRLAYESDLGIIDWISDRRLRSDLASSFGLTAAHVPDGIYRSPAGALVAFEVEIAQKAKSRYRDKLEHYVRVMRARRDDPQMFKQVHYLCLKPTVAKILTEESNMYGSLIKVEMAAKGLSEGQGVL